jgi:hypothetical protein
MPFVNEEGKRKKNALCLFSELVSKVKYEDERDVEVCSDECFCRPISTNEDCETACEKDNGEGHTRYPSCVWLEWCFWKLFFRQ